MNKYHAALIKAKHTFHASAVSSSLSNPRKLWQTVNKLFIVNLLMLYQTLCNLPVCQTLLPAFSHLRFTSFVLISGQIQTLVLLIYHALTFLLVMMSFVRQLLLKSLNLSVNLLILTAILILFRLLC